MTAQTQTAKHTPGPWEAHWERDRWIIGNYADNPHKVAECADACRMKGIDISPGEANASLIAAAPDLLAACRECVSEPGAKCWDDPEIAYRRLRAINDIARAAIARAEGRAEA